MYVVDTRPSLVEIIDRLMHIVGEGFVVVGDEQGEIEAIGTPTRGGNSSLWRCSTRTQIMRALALDPDTVVRLVVLF